MEKGFVERKLPGSDVVEKVLYKGTFRIVGRIVDNTKSKNIGYLILNEKTYTFKAFSIEQTKTLMKRFKFVNAELQNNEIFNTEKAVHGENNSETSFDKLPAYNSRLSLVDGKNKFMILGKVIGIDSRGDETVSYRVLDANLHFVELDELKLADYSNQGFVCTNGKLVSRQVKQDPKKKDSGVVNKVIVAPLKGDFPVIQREKVDEAIKELRKKKLEAKNTRYQAHLQKLIKGAPITLARCMGLDYRYRFKRMHYRSCKTDYFFKDDLRIEVNEIFKTLIKDKENVELLKKHLDNSSKENHVTNKTYAGISQFLLYVPGVYEETLKYALKLISRNPNYFKRSLIDKNSDVPYNLLKSENLLCKKYLELEKDILSHIDMSLIKSKTDVKDVKDELKPKYINSKYIIDESITKFNKSSEIAELGFCISKKNAGYKYTTKDNHHFTLKFIGEDFNDFDEYYALSTCFGDLYTIKKLKNFEISLDNFICNEKNRLFDISDSEFGYLELYSAMLYIYNPKLLKLFISKLEKKLDVSEIEKIPLKNISPENIEGWKKARLKMIEKVEKELEFIKNWDLDTNTELEIDERIKIYYASGYTSFYSTLKKDLINGKEPIINYRARFGIRKMNINHKLLEEELVPIIGMLTSDVCSMKFISGKIGKLHSFNGSYHSFNGRLY